MDALGVGVVVCVDGALEVRVAGAHLMDWSRRKEWRVRERKEKEKEERRV